MTGCRRLILLCAGFLCWPAVADADMPMVTLTGLARMRTQNISFFPVILLASALGMNVPNGFGSRVRNSPAFLFTDGSVKRLNPKIDQEVLRALSTPNGGEAVPPDIEY